MQKIVKSLIACAITGWLGLAVAADGAVADSIVTVDQLLKIDNAVAREKAHKDAVDAGLVKPESVSTKTTGSVRQSDATVTVHEIAGIAELGQMRISLTYNGTRNDTLTIGSKVQGCVVKAVKDQCVVLAPAASAGVSVKSKGKGVHPAMSVGSAAMSSPNMCPTSCWDGNIEQPVATVASGVTPLPGDGLGGRKVNPPLPVVPVVQPSSAMQPMSNPTIPAQPPLGQGRTAVQTVF